VAEAATRYGFADHVTDWRAVVADDRIGLFDNVGPNDLHAEPTSTAPWRCMGLRRAKLKSCSTMRVMRSDCSTKMRAMRAVRSGSRGFWRSAAARP